MGQFGIHEVTSKNDMPFCSFPATESDSLTFNKLNLWENIKISI